MPDFDTPPILEQVRTGTVRPFGSTGLQSAIQKDIRSGPVTVGKMGLEGDQQADRNFHGGPDKAVLHYALENYEDWTRELPDKAEMFSVGAFGENLCSRGLNESNLCLGDVIRVGSVTFEITQPRQPCFKLNHKFHLPSMARRVQETGRTGWYYRVLDEGTIEQGDVFHFLERPHPNWTLRRVQDFLYRDTLNEDALRELIALKPLSESMRDIFRKRMTDAVPEAWDARLIGFSEAGTTVGDHNRAGWRIVRVEADDRPTHSVRLLRLADPSGRALGPYPAGSHISVELSNGLVRNYSLCGRPDRPHYEIAIARASDSTGGSRFIHDSMKVGDSLSISPVHDRFSLDGQAPKSLFIAGGIGITPFMSMAEQSCREGRLFELHYCVRERSDALFADRLNELPPGVVHLHVSRETGGKRLDIERLLAEQDEDTHVYCCGPELLMRAVRQATAAWDQGRVHFERFAPSVPSGEPFQVKIASTGQILDVPAHASILQVLRKTGFPVPSSCETGSCGTCCVGLLDGCADHRDVMLSDEQRRTEIAVCVSRATGRSVLTLDL